MSIVTKTGDAGMTGLMYNRRVSKCDLKVEAYGTVDELNAALGLARTLCGEAFPGDRLFQVHKELVILMGELATDEADLERYVRDGFKVMTSEPARELEGSIHELESRQVSFRGWGTPGKNRRAAS